MKKQILPKIAAFFAVMLLLGGCEAAPPAAQEPPIARQTLFSRRENGIEQVAATLSPSVVGLAVSQQREEESIQGLGTGFFVDKSGYVLTNHHVAGDATEILAVLQDGSALPARLIWSDKTLDLAVVFVEEGGPFTPVRLGDMEALQVGQTVLAIGTPLHMAFQHTVTAGIVSGLNRTLQVPTQTGFSLLEELIQTDASINPGNSGGPLVTLDGAVVGINTLKVEDAEGMGFAIPADLARPIVQRILTEGDFTAPYLGLTVLDADLARYYGRQVKEGLAVLAVDPQGPAAAAGLREGEILLKARDKALTTILSLRKTLYTLHAGETLAFTVSRSGKTQTVEVTLA